MMSANANRYAVYGMARDTEFWANLRRILWAATASLLLGAGFYVWLGPRGLFAVAITMATAAISASIGERRPTRVPIEVPAQSDLTLLPPLAREMLERLPDPLMLVNGGDRVFFANRAMRDVIGVGIERKHVSAVLRNPSVLEALASTGLTGEPGSVVLIRGHSSAVCSGSAESGQFRLVWLK